MENIPKECRCPKLFEEIDRQGMSQKEFAEKIGASTGNVSDWVKGRAAPTRRRWQVISEVLGKPLKEHSKQLGLQISGTLYCIISHGLS